MIDFRVECLYVGHYLSKNKWELYEQGSQYRRMIYVINGDIVYNDYSSKLILERNHLYIFPNHKEYNVKSYTENSPEFLYFIVTMSPTLSDAVQQFDINESAPAGQLIDTIKNFIDNSFKKQLKYNPIYNHLLETLLMILSEKYAFSLLDDLRLKKVLQYMNDNLGGDLDGHTLAQAAGINLYYLIKVFSKNFGVTPHEYIANRRLEKARFLLEGDRPIEQIAFEVGFKDAKAFSRSFKKRFGVSPSEFRKRQFVQL